MGLHKLARGFPEASLCLCILQGCRRKSVQRGLWSPWHVAVQWGPVSCKPFGGHGPGVLQPCPDNLLIFVWLQAFVNQIFIHTQHQLKGNQGKAKFECRSRALCKELFQSGNSGSTCFVASLDLPVSFVLPNIFFFLCVTVFPILIKCTLFPEPVPLQGTAPSLPSLFH